MRQQQSPNIRYEFYQVKIITASSEHNAIVRPPDKMSPGNDKLAIAMAREHFGISPDQVLENTSNHIYQSEVKMMVENGIVLITKDSLAHEHNN